MTAVSEAQFLYLSTIGWKTGKRHRIEIWFVEHKGHYYVLSERGESAHWVQNILRNPRVSFAVSDKAFDGQARAISSGRAELATEVARLMKAKYGWSDGLIIELAPEK